MVSLESRAYLQALSYISKDIICTLIYISIHYYNNNILLFVIGNSIYYYFHISYCLDVSGYLPTLQ